MTYLLSSVRDIDDHKQVISSVFHGATAQDESEILSKMKAWHSALAGFDKYGAETGTIEYRSFIKVEDNKTENTGLHADIRYVVRSETAAVPQNFSFRVVNNVLSDVISNGNTACRSVTGENISDGYMLSAFIEIY